MPGWFLAVITTLAVGFGINAVVLAVTYASLIRPLPYAFPDRLVTVWEVSPEGQRSSVSPALFVDLHKRSMVFDGVAAYFVHSSGGQVLGTGEDAEWVTTASVTPNLFTILGVAPIRGALFAADVEAGVMLSHPFWVRRFAAAPDIVGTRLIIGGRAQPVIGILPPAFAFPVKADVYGPMVIPDAVTTREATTRYLGVVGRLRSGVTHADALAEISRFSEELAAQIPSVFRGWRATLLSLRELNAEGTRPTILALLGASTLVLLMACVNVTTLALAKGFERSREFAVYAALGAPPGTLALQLLTEACVLSLIAAVAGLITARWTMGVLRIALIGGLPRLDEAVVNVWVALSVLGAALVAALLAGIPLVLMTRRIELVSSLHGELPVAHLRSPKSLRSGLVAAQVALLVPLLVGTGLFTKTLINIGRIEPGFAVEGLITVQLRPPLFKYDRSGLRHLGVTLVERLGALPGVTSAAIATHAPLSGSLLGVYVVPEDPPHDRRFAASMQSVSDRYLNVMGIPLLRGRHFDEFDSFSGRAVVIVSCALAQRLWPTADAIGKRMVIEPESLPRVVVGVADDTRAAGLDQPLTAEVYVPFDQFPLSFMTAVVHISPSTPPSTAQILAAVRSVDRELGVARVASVDQLRLASTAAYRLRTFLVAGAGTLAAFLAATGIYSLISFVVYQHRREWAVRLVVGATPREVVSTAMRRALRPVALGGTVGLLGAFVLSSAIQILLVGVPPTDFSTYAGSVTFLGLLALLAAYVPARRAAPIDLTRALRAE
jgi:predicted permease